MSVIQLCNCKHTYQDQLYGPGRRVHNECKKPTPTTVCCTVCNTRKERKA